MADGLHMSTHAGALLLAALAYTYARKHADDPRFTFGTGKLGDLAGFTSAIILARIAVLIGHEAVSRIFAPVPIHFAEAIPIACLGLAVNIASALLLSGADHHHDHAHGHGQSHSHGATQSEHGLDEHVALQRAPARLSCRSSRTVCRRDSAACRSWPIPTAQTATVETVRPDGTRQLFTMSDRGGYLESVGEIPEPHEFTAHVRIGGKVAFRPLRGTRAGKRSA